MKKSKVTEIVAFEVDPDNVVVITDKSDPLYDPRIDAPWAAANREDLEAKLAAFGWTHGALELVKRGDYLAVSDGRQRTLALRAVNKARKAAGEEPILARAFLIQIDDEGTQEEQDARTYMRSWVANQGRLQDPPMIEAKKLAEFLRRAGGETPENIATAATILGCSTASVKNRLKLLEAAKPVQKALDKGEITQSDALRLVKKPVEEQEKALELIPKKDPTQPQKRRSKGKGSRKEQRAAGQITLKGKRGEARVPSRTHVRKVLEVMGEGHPFAPALAWYLGLLSEQKFLKACGISAKQVE